MRVFIDREHLCTSITSINIILTIKSILYLLFWVNKKLYNASIRNIYACYNKQINPK